MHRILFITGTLIGDVVMSTGVLDHLLRTHPDARFTIVCGRAAAQLFEALPRVERVIGFRKEKRDRHWLKLWNELREGGFDLAVDLRGSLVTWFIGARRRRVKRFAHAPHAVDDVAGVLGLVPAPSPRVWLTDAHRAWAAEAAPADRPLIVVSPGASWPGKRWPAPRFALLAQALARPGGRLEGASVAVLGGPGEDAELAEVYAGLDGVHRIDLGTGTSLLQAAAVFERAALFVGNDSGLMHLAAAAGAPTLGLFGPTDPARYAPRGRLTAVARTDRVFDFAAGTAFSSKSAPDATGLMDTLSVDNALSAALDLLSQTGDAG